MLPVTSSDVRLFLHVLGATVWVGGQLTLAGLVPGLRAISPDAPRAVARRFNVIAWSAFGLLFVTGLWNLAAIHLGDRSTAYQVTLFVKLVVVALSGVTAAVHAGTKSKAVLAATGALSFVSGVAALFLGIQLHG